MTPAELQQLLITHPPDMPGITAAARRDDDNPYRLTVTLAGGGRARRDRYHGPRATACR